MFNRYNDKQLRILAAVGKYKLVGYSQMKRLGIENHTSNLSPLLKKLTEGKHPLMKEVPHRPQYEKKFYLTSRGCEVLVNLTGIAEENVKYPKHTIKTDTSSAHETHRTQTIDFEIELDLACQEKQIEVLFFDRYFDKLGSTRTGGLKSKTGIKLEDGTSIEADAIFMLSIENEVNELFTFEQENGNDSRKSIDKMIAHWLAVMHADLNAQYDYQKAYHNLFIFGKESTMRAVLKRVKENRFFAKLKEHFLVKPYSQIGDDFFGGWRNLAGEFRKLYYL